MRPYSNFPAACRETGTEQSVGSLNSGQTVALVGPDATVKCQLYYGVQVLWVATDIAVTKVLEAWRGEASRGGQPQRRL